MFRTLLLLAAGIGVGAGGMTLAHHGGHGKGGVQVKVLSPDGHQREAGREEGDGNDRGGDDRAGQGGAGAPPPRLGDRVRPGRRVRVGIDGNKPKMFKAGETFYEPTGCLHDVAGIPSKEDKTRLIAVVLHPEDAKEIAIPEKERK